MNICSILNRLKPEFISLLFQLEPGRSAAAPEQEAGQRTFHFCLHQTAQLTGAILSPAAPAQFRPEFLNRLDEIIVFKSLTEEQIVEIVRLMIADLRNRLIAQGMSIELTDAARDLVAREGTDPIYGARPLRRAIQRLLEDPLSEQILEGRWTSGMIVDVDAKDGELVFSQGSGDIPEPRKRDTIAQEAELLLRDYNLGNASIPQGGLASGGAAS